MIVIVIFLLGLVLLYMLHRVRQMALTLNNMKRKISSLVCTDEVFDIVNQEKINLDDVKLLIKQSQSNLTHDVCEEEKEESREKVSKSSNPERCPSNN